MTVNAVSFPHQGGTVLYACSPSGPGTIAANGASWTAEKIHLVSLLREHLAGIKGIPWTKGRFADGVDLPERIIHDPLGRPRLLLGECAGPAVSFSEGGGKIWAALCGDASDIGIDAAATDEFPDDYPFRRAFHDQEFRHTLTLTSGDSKKASALLWSIKEAAVKALGCAFHLVDPLQIRVHPSVAESVAEKDDRYIFTAALSGKALTRFPLMAGRCIWVHSHFQEETWLSIALRAET
jgi:phosphopantetheinyl transferase (holo-ACP synthase)